MLKKENTSARGRLVNPCGRGRAEELQRIVGEEISMGKGSRKRNQVWVNSFDNYVLLKYDIFHGFLDTTAINVMVIGQIINIGTRYRSELNTSKMKFLGTSIIDNTAFTIFRNRLVAGGIGDSLQKKLA